MATRDTRPVGAAPLAVPRASTLGLTHVAACLDGSPLAEGVLAHAVAITAAFGADLTLLRVLEPPGQGEARWCAADPMDWEIGRLEAAAYLESLGAGLGGRPPRDPGYPPGVVLEGDAAVQIPRWAAEHEVDLVAFSTHGTKGFTEWPLASTARKLLDSLACSMLVVPVAAAADSWKVPRYRRVFVPLDGSVWAESALPIATQLARKHDALLILAHAVPFPELTRSRAAPQTCEDLDLERRLVARNERVGREYLDGQRARLTAAGLKVSTVVECNDRVAAELQFAIARSEPDLIVLPALGSSGTEDRPYGAVTLDVLSHARQPVLLIQPRRSERAAGTWVSTRRAAPSRPLLVGV